MELGINGEIKIEYTTKEKEVSVTNIKRYNIEYEGPIVIETVINRLIEFLTLAKNTLPTRAAGFYISILVKKAE